MLIAVSSTIDPGGNSNWNSLAARAGIEFLVVETEIHDRLVLAGDPHAADPVLRRYQKLDLRVGSLWDLGSAVIQRSSPSGRDSKSLKSFSKSKLAEQERQRRAHVLALLHFHLLDPRGIGHNKVDVLAVGEKELAGRGGVLPAHPARFAQKQSAAFGFSGLSLGGIPLAEVDLQGLRAVIALLHGFEGPHQAGIGAKSRACGEPHKESQSSHKRLDARGRLKRGEFRSLECLTLPEVSEMVNGTSSRRVAGLPLAAPRVSTARAQQKPVFSIDTNTPAAARTVPKQTLPNGAAVASTPAPQSQTSAAAADFRQLFNGLPAPPVPAVFTPPPFVPTFRSAAVTDGLQSWGLNHTYFATQETAQWIANRYGTGQVIEVPFGGSGGPFSASANEYHIKLADGRQVNAGILAGYYERNPETLFPGLADKFIRAQLGLG